MPCEQPFDSIGSPASGAHASGSGEPTEASSPGLNEGEIKVRKVLRLDRLGVKGKFVEVFTVSLDGETIPLLPLKTWSQLDAFKWRVRGKLPGTPPGLEITHDQVKVAGETVSTTDPQGPAKLERVWNAWLVAEKAHLGSTNQNPLPPGSEQREAADEEPFAFKVLLDPAGQPHIRCLEGSEAVAEVALTTAGINSLIAQGLMRTPGSWKIGALRDWIELDGELFKFHGDDASLDRFEKILNEQYLPRLEPDLPPDVLFFPNPASSSGFDIQFPSLANGLAETRRRHMDLESMELLSDPARCRVLRKNILVRFTPPNLLFKQKTPDGGERPLERSPDNLVSVAGSEGQAKMLDLSQPVSHAGLQAIELIAIFNHPAINRNAYLVKKAQANVTDMEHPLAA